MEWNVLRDRGYGHVLNSIREMQGTVEMLSKPWNKKRPMMLEAKPQAPTITMSFGLPISLRSGELRVERLEIMQTRCGEETFHRFQENRQAEGQKEDRVDECSQYFCTMPTIGVTSVGFGLARHLEIALGWGGEYDSFHIL